MGKRKPRIVSDTAELSADQRFCTHCHAPLKRKVAWLELDQRTNRYHDFGGVPESKSQGWFPFGVACATTILAQHVAP